MNRKIAGILIIVLGLIILISVVYIIFFYKWNKNDLSAPQTPIEEVKPKNIKTQQIAPTSPSVKKYIDDNNIKKDREITSEDLKRMAIAFAERFGSFSNHSDYGNILDLKIFMSAKMQIWADDFVNKQRTKTEDSSVYSGITTQAILGEIKKFDNSSGIAEILVKTQRRESKETMDDASIIHQDIIIKFIKENGLWKINSAEWQ